MAKYNPQKTAVLLRSLRIAKGETQDELAKILDVSRPAITTYETGTRTPSDEMKVKIAKHFNVKVGFLFYNER